MTLVCYFSPVPLSGLLPRALPFWDGCLVLMLQKQKGVAALPRCHLGNMWSVGGHSSEYWRWLILTWPSSIAISSQFAPVAISLFILYLRQSIECTVSLIQTGIDTDCIPSYVRSSLPSNSLHVLSIPSMIIHCHHSSDLTLRIHC